MIAALTLLVVLTLSIVVVRAGAVALRLTGIPEEVARFQARSAFTGAGFTTSESEAIVNHPVRRESGLAGRPLLEIASDNVVVLGLERDDGTFLSRPDLAEEMRLADEIFVYGRDDVVSSLHEAVRDRERAEA